MPSIRSLLTLTTFTLLQFTSAAPTAQKKDCKTPPKLPVNGGATELPAPTGTLAYIALGRGVQNYTCTAVGAAPTLLGAVATLYDGTALASSNQKALEAGVIQAVYKPTPGAGRNLDLPRPAGSLKVLGHHYFDSAGTPVFQLESSGKKSALFAKKLAGITAPPTADKGPAKTGAVDWLLLDQKPGYTSVNIGSVYRVVTAGGVGASCTKVGVESTEYATLYWFYK